MANGRTTQSRVPDFDIPRTHMLAGAKHDRPEGDREMGDPTIEAMLEKQITTLETNVNRRFDQQDKALGRIELKVDQTNGRVTTLERARERAQGFMFAFRWMPQVLTAAVTAGLTILTLAITGQVH